MSLYSKAFATYECGLNQHSHKLRNAESVPISEQSNQNMIDLHLNV